MEPKLCPFCKNPVQPNFIFCPTCGKNLMEANTPIPLSKQIGVYVISFLLPPLGLWPGIKYLIGKSPNGKQVGVIAIVLTTISITIAIIISVQFVNQINENINVQLNQYQNLGI